MCLQEKNSLSSWITQSTICINTYTCTCFGTYTCIYVLVLIKWQHNLTFRHFSVHFLQEIWVRDGLLLLLFDQNQGFLYLREINSTFLQRVLFHTILFLNWSVWIYVYFNQSIGTTEGTYSIFLQSSETSCCIKISYM